MIWKWLPTLVVFVAVATGVRILLAFIVGEPIAGSGVRGLAVGVSAIGIGVVLALKIRTSRR